MAEFECNYLINIYIIIIQEFISRESIAEAPVYDALKLVTRIPLQIHIK